VANGPSVDAMPPGFWRVCEGPGVLLIGCSRALCLRAAPNVAWDALVIRDTYRSLWADRTLGAAYHERLWKPSPAWKVGPADRRITHCDEYVRQSPGWQPRREEDRSGEASVMANASVALMAINWAYLAGAREIALVGVDYRGRHAGMIAPFDAGAGDTGAYDRPVPDHVERQFAEAVAGVAAGGGRLVNLSPGTRLRAGPMESFDASGNPL
jgi:hypothetical protein